MSAAPQSIMHMPPGDGITSAPRGATASVWQCCARRCSQPLQPLPCRKPHLHHNLLPSHVISIVSFDPAKLWTRTCLPGMCCVSPSTVQNPALCQSTHILCATTPRNRVPQFEVCNHCVQLCVHLFKTVCIVCKPTTHHC